MDLSGERAAAAPKLFVVHAAEDESFVKGFLMPAVGLREEEVLLSTRLELGKSVVAEIARGAGSALTVVVLSPSLLASPWGQLANDLATHASAERPEGGPLVVPAMLEDCELPLISRARVWLDFRRQDRWEEEVSRLRERLAAAPPEPAVVRCPYPGMLAFEEKSAVDFYGREPEIAQALAYLEAGARELYVIGSSGSGKSSLVAAGVIPKLQQVAVEGGTAYVVRRMRPGTDPLAMLAGALEMSEAAVASADWRAAVNQLLERHPEGKQVLIFVDQLEELFTTSKPAGREAFERALLALRGEARAVTLLTLRADFYGELINSALWEGVERMPMRLDVRALRGEALRDAIEKPARALGVYFEPVLVERLLQEVRHEAGALPLLQDALVQLWRERRRKILRLEDYERKATDGQTGLAARVRHRADAALQELTSAQQQLVRRVLLRLVQFVEGDEEVVTRRQQTRAALAAAGDDEHAVDEVIRHLADRRLVTTSEGVVRGEWTARVDLAHEVLLTAWPTLNTWIKERRGAEQRRRVLESKAAEWGRSGRGKTRLLDAEELAEVRVWLTQELVRELGPSELALALVTASEAAEATRAAALAALELQRREAEEEARQQRWEAERQLGLNLLEQGRSLLVDQAKPALAIPLLQRAIALGVEGSVLRTVLATLRRYVWRAVFFHRGSVHSAVFSPDGARVITASDDKTARVWDVATGQPVTKPLTHRAAVTSAAFSPDGARVVTASDDKTAQVWDVATGRPVGAPLEHQAAVTSATFGPDGTLVVTASWDTSARVWEAATGRAVASALAHQAPVYRAELSPDGTRVVTATNDGTAQLWEAATGQALGAAMVHRDAVTSVAFSADGTRVVTASADKTARLWDAATGRALVAPLVHHGWVNYAAFSSDGTRVVTASSDNTAQIWDAATGRALGVPLMHQAWVNRAAFSPDGTRVVTASSDSTARVWDAATGRALGAPLEHQSRVWSAAFSPDGSTVVTASRDSTARVWDVATGRALGIPLVHRGAVTSAAFSADGARVVTASNDKTARVWEAGTGRAVSPPLEHRAAVYRVGMSADGKRVVTASEDKMVRIWDAVSGRELGAPLTHRAWSASARFSADGTRLIITSHDNTAQVWDVEMGQRLGAPLEHRRSIHRAGFSADGALVATASADRTAQVWEVATGKAFGPPLAHPAAVTRAVFSADGSRLITTCEDQAARVWDVATAQALCPPLRHQAPVLGVAFSPDGRRVVTASADNLARVWEVATGRPLNVPLTHRAWVNYAAFSRDGARVVTASSDKTARVWEVETGRPLSAPLEHQDEVYRAELSPDGSRVVTASKDHTARVWEVAETGALEVWSAQAQRSMAMPDEEAPFLRSELAQRPDDFEDLAARAGSLLAIGDQQLFSRVWAVPRATYERAVKLLEDCDSTPLVAARRDELAMRLAMLDALQGGLEQARERLGAKDAVEDAALLDLLAGAAHDELCNDDVTLALLREAQARAPAEPGLLTNLVEAYFSSGERAEAARLAAEIDPRRTTPEQRVVLAALAWASARLSRSPERAAAKKLLLAYAALEEAQRIPRAWRGTRHALTYGRASLEEAKPILDLLALLEESVSAEVRTKLSALLAARGAPRGRRLGTA